MLGSMTCLWSASGNRIVQDGLTYLALGKLLNGKPRFTVVVNIMACNPDTPFQEQDILATVSRSVCCQRTTYPNNCQKEVAYPKVILLPQEQPSSNGLLMQTLQFLAPLPQLETIFKGHLSSRAPQGIR